jgi:porphobilinogen synthase
MRRLVRETNLSPNNFVLPIFVRHGEDVVEPIPSLPGVARLSVDHAVRTAERCRSAGVPAVLLFGVPAQKNPRGEENFAEDGIVQQAVRAIKRAVPELVVTTDVCMCQYTDSGHCGVIDHDHGGEVLNDETVEILRAVAVSHAAAGADMVAPSGMMDGAVAAMRDALDHDGFTSTGIMAYAVKYASALYGPFRDAAGSALKFGDRRTHQMDPANAREALREAAFDAQEGADMLMVKPALFYLDVIHRLREQFASLPIAAYNVSGEYSMVKAAAAQGWVDERAAALEMLTAIRRAGADIVITYWALDAAGWI